MGDKPNIDPKLVEMMVCPFTKTRLEWSKDKKELISYAARLAFPVRNNVPLLVLDEARQLKVGEERNS
jgi:uncharacterized protein YbaR (Trm112 family)